MGGRIGCSEGSLLGQLPQVQVSGVLLLLKEYYHDEL